MCGHLPETKKYTSRLINKIYRIVFIVAVMCKLYLSRVSIKLPFVKLPFISQNIDKLFINVDKLISRNIELNSKYLRFDDPGYSCKLNFAFIYAKSHFIRDCFAKLLHFPSPVAHICIRVCGENNKSLNQRENMR